MDTKESDLFKLKVLDQVGFEILKLPYVYGLSEGGSYSVIKPEVALYKFRDASFNPDSDVIRVDGKVFWAKSRLPQFTKLIPRDIDLVRQDIKNKSILIRQYPLTDEIEIGFSLCGVHVKSWGHFIGTFLSKIASLEHVKEKCIQIILPDHVDDHIKELLGMCLKNYPNTKINLVRQDRLIHCNILYYCTPSGYLADHASYIHLSDLYVTRFGGDVIYQLGSNISSEVIGNLPKKLFIGRTTARNLINYAEVESFFVKLGFEVVHPHLMSFKDKVSIFSSATHVCGPGSSGFLNFIFSRNSVKVLELSSFQRTLDLFRSVFMQEPFNHQFILLTGDESKTGSIHNSYYISLQKIKECLAETGYLT